MRVEACCQRLLSYALPLIDEKREGLCIDAGVGTFAFYCEMFAMMGFKTIALEPLPTEGVRTLCKWDGITLFESCLSDTNGSQTLYLGEFGGTIDSNYSSLLPDWFGASGETRQVHAVTLPKLLLGVNAEKLTCLKLDIEGAEFKIISQFKELPQALLPKIVMFEYGGGGCREAGEYGWSPNFFQATLDSLSTLQECGYSFSIMIDNAFDTEAKVFDLQSPNLELESVFYKNGGYGNIIAFRDFKLLEDEVVKLCTPYYEATPSGQEGLTDLKTFTSLSTAEALELSHFQLQQTREELGQQKANLLQVHSELQQNKAELQECKAQLQKSQGEVTGYKEQLQQTQDVLQEYQEQLLKIQEILTEHQNQLQHTQAELAQSNSQLQHTQAELAQSNSQLQHTRAELAQSNSQLRQTQAELAQSNSQLRQTQADVTELNSQLHQARWQLDRSEFQLQQTQWEFEKERFQLYQLQEELEKSNSQIQQVQSELDRIQTEKNRTQSQLYQARIELKYSHSLLYQVQEESCQLQTKLLSVQEELTQSQFQLHQMQGNLSRLQVQQSMLTDTEFNEMRYRVLIWEAWYAYQNGELNKMKESLLESLNSTPFSNKTETVNNWLENFTKFSLEQGGELDTFSLTSSQEWKQATRRAITSQLLVKTSLM